VALVGLIGLAGAAAWMGALGGASAGAAPVTSGSDLGALVIATPLPGYVAAPPGVTNGALTASAFASQSATPATAAAQFNALAAQTDFGAYLRLWTEAGSAGSAGAGANDLAILLFRIPDATVAEAFATGLLQPFLSSATSQPFDVPSIAGAHGFSVTVTTPVHATQQIVVFTTGEFVVMVQCASATTASNVTPLTAAQAVAVSYEQFTALPVAAPITSPPSTTHASPAHPSPVHPSAVPSAVAAGAGNDGALVLGTLIAIIVCAGLTLAFVLLRKRPRASARHRVRSRGEPPVPVDPVPPSGPVDPWGPDGIFAAMGAVVLDRSVPTPVTMASTEVTEGKAVMATTRAGATTAPPFGPLLDLLDAPTSSHSPGPAPDEQARGHSASN
jgi:hypothetical protein